MMIDFAEMQNIPSALVLTKVDKFSRSKMIQEKEKQK